jgi:hypothetical protein
MALPFSMDTAQLKTPDVFTPSPTTQFTAVNVAMQTEPAQTDQIAHNQPKLIVVFKKIEFKLSDFTPAKIGAGHYINHYCGVDKDDCDGSLIVFKNNQVYHIDFKMDTDGMSKIEVINKLLAVIKEQCPELNVEALDKIFMNYRIQRGLLPNGKTKVDYRIKPRSLSLDEQQKTHLIAELNRLFSSNGANVPQIKTV